MLLTFAIAAAIVIAAFWLRYRRREAPGASSPAAPASGVNPDGSGRFHAISIRARPDACDAAREIHGLRFLSAEVPELPLPECDVANCGCRFVRHRDRRSGDDRRSPFQGGYGGSSTRREEDRRRIADRRGAGDPGATQ